MHPIPRDRRHLAASVARRIPAGIFALFGTLTSIGLGPPTSTALSGEPRPTAGAPRAPSSEPRTAADLRSRIAEAVRKGRGRLLSQLPGLVEKTASDYPVGRLAFPVAAVLKAGASPDDPAIVSALEKLSSSRPGKTYCVACYLVALDVWLERRREEGSVPGGSAEATVAGMRGTASGASPPKGKVRTPPAVEPATSPTRPAPGTDDPVRDAALARVRELTAWLVAAQVRGHGSWTYGKPAAGAKHDFSNTQFAVLGLEAAANQGIAVPAETFLGALRCFAGSAARQGDAVEVELAPEVSLEDRLGGKAPRPQTRVRATPAGWGYTDPRRFRSSRPDPYPSMTAAGASCLSIAIHALRTRGGAAVPREAEAALAAAHAWIAVHLDDYLADGPNLLYTLYSLEKVGDLARIERFGGRSWYEEGALRILELQRKDGGWGSYVDTSFALLFLTRATRLFSVSPAPVVLTGERRSADDAAAGRAAGGGADDLVYVSRLDGFISVRELLRFAAERRSGDLLPVAREAVRNYRPDAADDLVPPLLALWSRPDAVTAFAIEELRRITGLDSRDRAAYERWQRDRRELASIEACEAPSDEALEAAIRRAESPRLKALGASMAGRKGLKAMASFLVDELDAAAPEYRRALHGVLSLWTEQAPAAPPDDDPAAWAATIEAWRACWLDAKIGRDT